MTAKEFSKKMTDLRVTLTLLGPNRDSIDEIKQEIKELRKEYASSLLLEKQKIKANSDQEEKEKRI